ncbi:MAG TPA: metallophosphoesterase family protein [Ktedonobacterales bacterium]|nr:metallophosphoesterase family protein [Ktedonobacterales bacterium]
MRLAVLADIHGNAIALEAVLADLEQAPAEQAPAEQVVCLGDAIQGGPQPAEVVAQLRALACPVVMGNADAWLLTGHETGNEPITAAQETMRQWSLARLSPADREFIAAFVPTVTLPLPEGKTLLAFHGSPASFDDILLPETPYDEFTRRYGPYAPAILTGGHTHIQYVRRLGETFYFNPGSVGVVYDQHQPDDPDVGVRLDAWAEYAVLEVRRERLALELRRVPFAAEALIQAARAAGSPGSERLARQYSRL